MGNMLQMTLSNALSADFDWNFTEVFIGLGNGLAMNKWGAIIWTNHDQGPVSI